MEHTFFNLGNALTFYQKTWEDYPSPDDDLVPLSEDAFALQFQNQIEEIERSRNKFGLLFHIHHPSNTTKKLEINRWVKLERFTDNAHLSFENFLKAIHPQFVQTYLHHAHTAYRTLVSIFSTSGNPDLGLIQFSVRVPILRTCPNGTKEYWWMYQAAHPAKLLPNGVIVSHFNVYEFKSKFHENTATSSLHPSIVRLPDYQEHRVFTKIYQEEFLKAFWEVCNPQEASILKGLMQGASRKEIANSLEIEEGYLSRILIGRILKR
jgi:hypothetical protein